MANSAGRQPLPTIMWFRRDLRVTDHPALLAAATAGPVVPLFVIDPALWASAGVVRQAWLAASIQALDTQLHGLLVVRMGDPAIDVPRLAREIGAAAVHVTRETTPAGVSRDHRVATLVRANGVEWIETGSPYAVGPGRVVKADGTPYRVFTPFLRAWNGHGSPSPAPPLRSPHLVTATSDPRAWEVVDTAASLASGLPPMPAAGEQAALRLWQGFVQDRLTGYAVARDRTDVAGTSWLSPYLKVGAIHPRTLLTDLGGRGDDDAQRFRTQLAWREFYADVLWHSPTSAWSDLVTTLGALEYDDPADPAVGADLQAWKVGRTGFPIVDAGMRQLLATGWMHNRARMITASFLTKDLHVRWQVGARHFLDHLLDGDIASNNHGWQWVAGTGTDASPYVRIFNPVTQGLRVDPLGEYVRRWVPELAHLPGSAVHEPWAHPQGYAAGYPARILDHAQERGEALRRFAAARHSR